MFVILSLFVHIIILIVCMHLGLIPSNNQLVFNSSYHLDSLETFNNLVHATHHVKNHVIRPLNQINSLNSNQIMKYSHNFVDYFYKYDDSKQLLSRYIDANDIDDLKRKYFGNTLNNCRVCVESILCLYLIIFRPRS